MIIDAGCGDKMDAEERRRSTASSRRENLDVTLAARGVGADDIEIVLASHLHFDHAGGFTARDASGAVVPRFPHARYLVNDGEWDDATHPHERNRASYFAENYVPLQDAGVARPAWPTTGEVDARRPRAPHRRPHPLPPDRSTSSRAAGPRSSPPICMPTTAHVDVPWIMAYDLYPMETLAFKRAFVREAIEREYLIFFEHDPAIAAGYIREKDKRLYVEPLSWKPETGTELRTGSWNTEHERSDQHRHHRRHRPVRHGGADRPRRADGRDAVRRSVGPVPRRHAARASAWRSSRGTAPATG